MYVAKYKIKSKVKRDGPNKKSLELGDNKELVSRDKLDGVHISELPTISAKLGAENETAKRMALSALSDSDEECDVTITLKFLEE